MYSLVKQDVVCWLVVTKMLSKMAISWWWNRFLVFFHLTSLSSIQPKIKSVKLLVSLLSHYRAKTKLANQIAGFQIKYIFRIKWCQELRVYWNILGWVWSKIVLATLIKRWLDETMDELSSYFVCWCKFRKVKNYCNNFWVAVVKNVHGTLISEGMDKSSWTFAC